MTSSSTLSKGNSRSRKTITTTEGSELDTVAIILNATSVVIDHDILGWGEEHREELLKKYQKIVKVGSEPGLERRKSDLVVASYCKKNDCDQLTGDLKAYQYYFEAGVKSIQVSRYDWATGPDKAIFLIQIVE